MQKKNFTGITTSYVIGPVVRKSQFKFPFDSEKSHYEMEK